LAQPWSPTSASRASARSSSTVIVIRCTATS
jgi:hypothetical protein